jgi:ATP:ADP antiporter, AAA family
MTLASGAGSPTAEIAPRTVARGRGSSSEFSASVQMAPPGLPTGMGRIGASAAGTAAAVATAWALGARIELPELVALTIGPVLLLVAIVIGVGGRAISIGAVVPAVFAGAFAGGFDLAGLATVAGYVLIPCMILAGVATLWSMSYVGPLGRAAAMGTLATAAAIAWSLLVALGIYGLLRAGLARPVGAAIATALLTLMASSIGRSSALNIGSSFGVMRDAVFRALTLATGLVAAAWAGTALEAHIVTMTIGTPLESLAPIVSWMVAIGAFAALVSAALWLPRWLIAAQLRGRVTAVAVGEPLVFMTLACVAALVLWRQDQILVPGRACWIALASGAAYAYWRIRYAAPIPSPNTQLWIVLCDMDVDGIDDAASEIAAAWPAGQVTVLAVPAAAQKVAGEHLHAAERAGQGTALFPLRPVHLEDWDDAQPARWPSLPVRELYAPPRLWPHILGERLDPSAHVLALVRAAAPGPSAEQTTAAFAAKSLIDRVLRVAHEAIASVRRERERRVLGLFVPRSNAPALRPNLEPQDAERLALGEVIAGEQAVIQRLRALRPLPSPLLVRHVIVQCAPGDEAMAEELARRIHGAYDTRGRIVECWAVGSRARYNLRRRLADVPGRPWRRSWSFIARLLGSAAHGRGVEQALVGFIWFFLAWDRGAEVEYELVTIESESPTRTPALPQEIVEAGLTGRVISRLVSVRSAAAEATGRLTYPPRMYAGQVRAPHGKARDVVVAHLADKLLALDLLTVEQTATVAPPSARLSLVDRALRLFSDVRAGEGGTALLMFSNLLLLLTAYYVIRTVRDALVVAQGGAEVKAYSSAVQALVLMVFVPAYSWFASRVNRARLIMGVLAFFLLNLALFAVAFARELPYTSVVFYIWVGIYSMTTVSLFWSFANDIYRKESGERIFPVIMLGATVGGPLGAWLAQRLFETGVSPVRMLQAVMAILLFHFAFYRWANRRESGRPAQAAVAQAPLGAGGGFGLVFASPYIRLVALLMIVLSLVNTVGNFILDSAVERVAAAAVAADPTVDRIAVIGSFYGGFNFWQNVLAVAIQALLVSRIVKYFGLRGLLLMLPMVAFGAYGFIAAGAGLTAIRWAKTAENATDYSAMNTGRHMLWLPTRREEKYKAKQAVDTFFVRTGDVLAGALVFAGTHWLAMGRLSFTLVNFGLIGLWVLLLAVLIRRHGDLSARVEPDAPASLAHAEPPRA